MRTEAFAAFYRDFYPRLCRFVLSQTGAAAGDVEDLVQETLLHAWRNRAGFLGKARHETWILSIAMHKVADYWRGRARSDRRMEEAVRRALADLDTIPVPEELLDTTEMRRRVCEALERLNEDYGQALTLRYIKGFSVRAIAEQLGESESAIESRLTRARETFRKLLGGSDE